MAILRRLPAPGADGPGAVVEAAPPTIEEEPPVAFPIEGRMRPEELEGEHLLDGLVGLQRERLGGLLLWAATSYRTVLVELDAAKAEVAGKQVAGRPVADENVADEDVTDGGDRFADLGDHVARVLRAAQEAAAETARLGVAEIDRHRTEVDAELARRRDELDERERDLDQRVRAAEEAAAAITAEARAGAERLAASSRGEAERRLAALLSMQESLRDQLVQSSSELRQRLDALTPAGD